MTKNKILQNAAVCAKCGDEVWSATRHDYRECKCGAIAVDGGLYYIRRVGDLTAFLDRSIYASDRAIEDLKEAVKWARETGRNDLGTALAVIRVLQKYGVVDTITLESKFVA
jgi:hypothetical protein